MTINTGTKVISIEKKDGKAKVVVENSRGGNLRVLEAEMVLVSIGRRAFVKGLRA